MKTATFRSLAAVVGLATALVAASCGSGVREEAAAVALEPASTFASTTPDAIDRSQPIRRAPSPFPHPTLRAPDPQPDPDPDPGPDPDPAPGPDPDPDPDPDPAPGPDPDPAPGPDPDPDPDPGPDPDPDPDPDPAPEPGPEPGLIGIGDLTYAGAFRLPSDDFGVSNVNYAVGTLAYNPARHSLFIAGHAHHNAVAEFAIPDTFGRGGGVGDLPVARQPIQAFASVLDAGPNGNPDGMDRITGMQVVDGALLVNANRWYDGEANATDTTLVVRDAANLGGTVDGYFELDGAAVAAGYLSDVPAQWRNKLGGSLLSGWASNYSIIGRYSVGPSLFTLDPSSMLSAPVGAQGPVDTTTHMAFPHRGGAYLDPGALTLQPGRAPATWNFLSKAMHGFIVPGTRTFAVLGSNGGIDSGVGYKITQDDGNLCPGHCSYEASDNYNYFWLFDLDDLVDASSPASPRPYAHGRWSIPFDDGGEHLVVGAAFDAGGNTLYVALANAGQVGTYDRPPLIVAYNL